MSIGIRNYARGRNVEEGQVFDVPGRSEANGTGLPDPLHYRCGSQQPGLFRGNADPVPGRTNTRTIMQGVFP